MSVYRVLYARHPAYGLGSQRAVARHKNGDIEQHRWPEPYGVLTAPELFTVARLSATHVVVRTLEATSLDAVYTAMQVERMPQLEYEQLEQIVGQHQLPHSSMCAGDVVEDIAAGIYYECEVHNWRVMD